MLPCVQNPGAAAAGPATTLPLRGGRRLHGGTGRLGQTQVHKNGGKKGGINATEPQEAHCSIVGGRVTVARAMCPPAKWLWGSTGFVGHCSG